MLFLVLINIWHVLLADRLRHWQMNQYLLSASTSSINSSNILLLKGWPISRRISATISVGILPEWSLSNPSKAFFKTENDKIFYIIIYFIKNQRPFSRWDNWRLRFLNKKIQTIQVEALKALNSSLKVLKAMKFDTRKTDNDIKTRVINESL